MKFFSWWLGAALVAVAMTQNYVVAMHSMPSDSTPPTHVVVKDDVGVDTGDVEFEMPYGENIPSALLDRRMRRKFRSFLTLDPDTDFPAADTVTCDRKLPDVKARLQAVWEDGDVVIDDVSVAVVAKRQYRVLAMVCLDEDARANAPTLQDAAGQTIETKWKVQKRDLPLADDLCGDDGHVRLFATKIKTPVAADGDDAADRISTVTVSGEAPALVAFSPKRAKMRRQKCLCTDRMGNSFVGQCGRLYRKWAETGEKPVPLAGSRRDRKRRATILTIERLQAAGDPNGRDANQEEDPVIVPDDVEDDYIAPGEQMPAECQGDTQQIELATDSVLIMPRKAMAVDHHTAHAWYDLIISNLDAELLPPDEQSLLHVMLACPAHNLVASGLVDHVQAEEDGGSTVTVTLPVAFETLHALINRQTCTKVNGGYQCNISMKAQFSTRLHSCLVAEASIPNCHASIPEENLDMPGTTESPSTGVSPTFLLPLEDLKETEAAHATELGDGGKGVGQGANRRLLQTEKPPMVVFVHGYCDNKSPFKLQNSWRYSAANPDGRAIEFDGLDRGSYSNDVFARAIDAWADSHGVTKFAGVGHSQGGNALLHLYNYYWSGLDNVQQTGRLIQAVGTPWLGTPLAGNIAALGSVFGVGCGYNYDLTTGGASSWLSGISSSARSKVRYYTTSYRDRWWSYDYCHLASDFVLGDPEDGTVEKSRATLAGGNNGGHKTNQCHISGMRDPPQTEDMNRNTDMYNNAPQ